MRLAIFCWEFPPKIVGGLGTYISEIVPRFVKAGHDVTVFTLNDGNLKTHEVLGGVDVHRPRLVDIQDVLPSVVADDIKRWGPGTKFFADVMLYNFLSSSKLVNELVRAEGRHYDAIVAHDWLSIMGGLIGQRELGRRLVFHVHSTEKGRAMGNGSKTVSELEVLGGQRAYGVVTVSYAMKEELVSLGFPEGKINVVYNGVDPAKYDPARVNSDQIQDVRTRYGLTSNDPMILFVGRIVVAKGVDKLLQSMKLVEKEVPSAKLVVVGTSDMQEAIREHAKSQSLQDRVKLRFEFISEEERIAHYAASDVCVFPSLYEPFGIVALEAMSMAKPVVVGAKGTSGMREFVSPSGDQQAGFHVDPQSPPDIAWAITRVLEDGERAKKLGQNGRNAVLENFTWDMVAQKTLSLYDKLAA